jgi:hypothetical protein
MTEIGAHLTVRVRLKLAESGMATWGTQRDKADNPLSKRNGSCRPKREPAEKRIGIVPMLSIII